RKNLAKNEEDFVDNGWDFKEEEVYIGKKHKKKKLQINDYEKLYLEDIKMLEENENNIDEDTGYLLNNVVADCFERFQNILSKIPKLIGLLLLRCLGKKLNLNP
ncbi:1464_t:CDS:2, partial [Gigaspora rosea]